MSKIKTNKYKVEIEKILNNVDIKINGNRPWDIKVHNEDLYKRVLAKGNLGFAESYMEGWWDCEKIDELIFRLMRKDIHRSMKRPGLILQVLLAKLTNNQSKSRSKKVAEVHYDIGNDLYKDMLGKTMQYTCAYWEKAKNLDQAQTNKMDLVCKKLGLKKGDKVLELGCGWGTFSQFMAKKYGCHVTAYNISDEQVKYAKEINKGLPVEIVHSDYRDAIKLKKKFDKVVSVGLMEHVGEKNYKDFMKLVKKLLKPEGVFLLHTIGKDVKETKTDPFITKYIFPGGMLPSPTHLSKASNKTFIIEDWHNISANYDHTLMAWNENFQKSWPKYKEKYGEKFKRMWEYYLLSCAAGFRSRRLQLWQVVYSPHGVLGGYKSIR